MSGVGIALYVAWFAIVIVLSAALHARIVSELEQKLELTRKAIIFLAARTEGEARAMVDVLSCRLGFGHAAYLKDEDQASDR